MSFRKTQISLLLIALVSCFMMAAQAASAPCYVCLFDEDADSDYDPSEGACLMFYQSGNGGGGALSTPFVGDENGFTVDSFRYVGFKDCGLCTFTAYSSADFGGQSAVIDGSVGYSSLGFDGQSFAVECEPAMMIEEEEEVVEEYVKTRRYLRND